MYINLTTYNWPYEMGLATVRMYCGWRSMILGGGVGWRGDGGRYFPEINETRVV
ncbi:hypothetical protein DPMN_047295 [Dreissena polymorpha]|uniref:Uncharacterized protein n=1 Tax=Dreissena polymorpha TaxID=45954 RepID=A0A9D4I1A6_DREPO|nr:hypothetical protein DPMN_047295 [Dreissena polymorpha]